MSPAKQRLAAILKSPIYAVLLAALFSATAGVWFGLAWVGFQAARGLGW